MKCRRKMVKKAAPLVLLICLASESFAGSISFVDLYFNQVYNQTTAAQPAANPAYYYVGGRLYMENAGQFTAGNLTLPGGVQPTNGTNNGANPDMALVNPTTFLYETPGLTQSEYTAEFPAGTYTYTGTDTPDQSVAVNYSGTASYTTTVPYFTNFTGLQGMNAGVPFTIMFNPFAGASPGTCNGNNDGTQTCAFVFLDIFEQGSGNDVFSQAFLPSSTTAVTIPANTLLPNTQYAVYVDFSNRALMTYASGSADFPAEFGFDTHTNASFTTAAVPEPSTAMLTVAGLMLAIALRRRLC